MSYPRAPFSFVAFNATVSGAGNTVVIASIEGRDTISFEMTWAGNLAMGNGKLEVSNNYNAARPTDARWTQITDAATNAALQNTPASGGVKADGLGGSGILTLGPSTFGLTSRAIRLTWPYSSGSGNFSVDVATR